MNPRNTEQDHYLQQTAAGLGMADSYGPVPNAIHFGNPDVAEQAPGCNSPA